LCSSAPDNKQQRSNNNDYTSRLTKFEADPIEGRDNLTSNLKLAGGVFVLLAGLTYGFLASNGAV
jgi:hypothetical protein